MPLAGILLFAIGVASAFWGYKLRALFRFIPGLWAGALIGGITGFALTKGPVGAVIGAVVLGIVCAVISAASEKAGVFLEFFSYGYAPVVLVVATTGSPFIPILVAAVVGAITGTLGRFASRMWIIITTSLVGGLMGGIGLGILLMNPTIAIIAALVMVIGGICVQQSITSKPAAQTTPVSQPNTAPQAPVPPERPIAAPAATPASGPKFCPNCGKPVSAGSKFCPECGGSLAGKPFNQI